MAAISKNSAETPQKFDTRGLVICQIFGLIAMALVIHSVMNHNYRIFKYLVAVVPMILMIPKPNYIPYLFILNFFVPIVVWTRSMISVMVMDAMFIILIMAFIANKKITLKDALEKQRGLFIALCAFMLWATLGFVVNFYGHKLTANATSAFFLFNVAQLITAVIVFSRNEWKVHREKIIVFYLICSVLEIAAALAIEFMSGARTIKDLYKLTGTLGAHHGMLALVLILSTGVAAAAFFQLRDKRLRHFSLCVCFACVTLLFVSGSRSAIMGMLLAVPAIVFLNYSHKKSTWFVLLFSIFIATVAFWMTPLRDVALGMLNFQNMGNPDASAYTRLLIWERVYQHALYGPWIQKIVGIGIGTFITLKFDYFLEGGAFATGAHNNYMHAFVETGIVGLIIFLSIFTVIIRRLVLMGKHNDNAAKCFLMCTLAFLFSGLTQETYWFNPAFGRIWLQYLFCYLMLFNFNDTFSKNLKNEIGSYAA